MEWPSRILPLLQPLRPQLQLHLTSSASDQALIAQLQAQVAQYQAREQQYQAALNSDNQQLSQAASEQQMIQQLLAYLQQRGVISIDSQGNIYVNGR